MLSLCHGGCSRPFWRTQADFDTYNLLLEKSADERWRVPRLTLEADPRARIFDPYDPDVTPLPPDDPAAHQYMHWIDGMQAYQSWHKFGQQMTYENPQWLAQFDLSPEDFQVDWIDADDTEKKNRPPHIVPTLNNLTLEQSLELANMNSREYQFQLESTYLSALALTFSRFQFNVRYLGLNGLQPTSNLNYINQPSTLDTLQFANRGGISQLLPTGGQWIVELANNTLWLFSTPGRTESASVLTYSLVQPLLAGGGRKVVLENLTLTERQLLYNIRTLARFRKIFFTNMVVNDPNSSGGFLGLMQQTQQVDNLRSNLREYRIQIEKLREINYNPRKTVQEKLEKLPEGLEIPEDLATRFTYDAESQRLQWRGEFQIEDEERLIALSDDPDYQRAVRSIAAAYRLEIFTQDLSQVLPNAANVQNQLRSAEAGLLDNIDDFKLLMGLPTDFQVTLDRSLLKPFELIDPRLTQLEDRLQQTIKTWQDPSELEITQQQLDRITRSLLRLAQTVEREGLQLAAQDLERERKNRPQRLERLPNEAAREQVRKNVERDQILYQRNREEFELLIGVLRELASLLTATELPEEEPKEATPLDTRSYPYLTAYAALDHLPTRDDALGVLRAIREDLLQIVQGLKVIQVGSRSELITLRDFDISLEDAVALAMEHRLDLMNARGAVMDARRNLELVANKMEGVLNVVTRGDIRNSGGSNPFDFRADDSTFQFGLQFTAPLDQVLVRNNYRAALIAYQQARRAYMLLEDTIKRDVRFEWRQLQLNKANFETARQNIRYAAIQYDVTVETTYQPSTSAESALPAVGSRLGARQNAGLNLLNALNGILNAQNNLINFWVTYERNRINIYKDMDIMVIDERGLWVDAAYQPGAENVAPSSNEPADVVPPAPAALNDREHFSVPDPLVGEEGPSQPSRSASPDAGGSSDFAGVFRLAGRAERRAVAGDRVLPAVER